MQKNSVNKWISYSSCMVLYVDQQLFQVYIFLVWRRISTELDVLTLNTEWRILKAGYAYDKSTEI